MALQSWTKDVYSGSGSNINWTGRINITENSISGNSSNVTYNYQLILSGYSWRADSTSWSITGPDGTHSGSLSKEYRTGTVDLGSWTTNVAHNSDGSGSASFSASISSTFLVNGSGSTSVTLTKINVSRSLVVRIKNQNIDGSYGDPWVWINTTVDNGTTVDYWGYGNSSGPDNYVYNVIRYNKKITSNTDETINASRRTWYRDINALSPEGVQDNASLQFNIKRNESGQTYNNVTNEPSGWAPRYGETITISNIHSIKTGAHYTTNNITGTGATSFTYTANETTTPAVTLYSAWNTYTIKYNMNGGTGTISDQTKTYGTNLKLSSTIPTKKNRKFLGWSTSSTATSATYTAGQTLTSDLTTTDGDTVTLYAVWVVGVKVITSSGTQMGAIKIITSSGVSTPSEIKVIKT